MTNCIKPPGIIITGKGTIANVSCKMRNCPVCSRVIRNQLMDRVKLWFADDELRFMTLTMQADDKSNIMDHWHVLLVDLKRHYPGIRGFWVKEYTKRKVAHLHILVNRFVDQAWLSRRWLEITGTSYIAYIERIDDIRNPAAYMLKYMTKAHGELDLYGKGERIYGFFGAVAPKKVLLGFDDKVEEFYLDQHYNVGSAYWLPWYNQMQLLYGPAFIEYIELATQRPISLLQTSQIKHL